MAAAGRDAPPKVPLPSDRGRVQDRGQPGETGEVSYGQDNLAHFLAPGKDRAGQGEQLPGYTEA